VSDPPVSPMFDSLISIPAQLVSPSTRFCSHIDL